MLGHVAAPRAKRPRRRPRTVLRLGVRRTATARHRATTVTRLRAGGRVATERDHARTLPRLPPEPVVTPSPMRTVPRRGRRRVVTLRHRAPMVLRLRRDLAISRHR